MKKENTNTVAYKLKLYIGMAFFLLTVSVMINAFHEKTRSSVEARLPTVVKTTHVVTKTVNDGNDIEFTFYEATGEVPVDHSERSDPTKFAVLPEPTVYLRGKPVVLEESPLRCLAMNAYLEARDRSEKMQEVTAWTVLGRVGKYTENTVCDVVTKANYTRLGEIKAYQCAFSWFCDPKNNRWAGNKLINKIEVAENEIEDEAYRKAVKIASRVLNNYEKHGFKYAPVKNVTHYHREDKNPWWVEEGDMKFLVKIDDHLFYNGH